MAIVKDLQNLATLIVKHDNAVVTRNNNGGTPIKRLGATLMMKYFLLSDRACAAIVQSESVDTTVSVTDESSVPVRGCTRRHTV